MKIKNIILILLSLLFLVTDSWAGDFFSIEKIGFYKKPPRKNQALFKQVPILDKNGKPTKQNEKIFVPCLFVEVKTAGQVRSNTLFAHAYFYGNDRTLIDAVNAPSANVDKGAMPMLFKNQERTELFFAVPDKVLKLKEREWSVVLVFGDYHGATARAWPGTTSLNDFEYPEKALVGKKESVERKAAIDPVVEQVVKTGNPQYEHFTLFMRPPNGITQGKDVQGVMAMSVLANNPGEIREYLLDRNPGGRMGYALDFADKNKLAIIAWGARRLWDPNKNWDEQNKATNKEMDETFDDMARAWSKGVEVFVKKYGIPDKDYLIWGASGSAQFSCRLALRKPEYFLAIHAHIPSSFDEPTPEASRVLWCLTTGEREAGYERSIRFYSRCRELGYPMIYKAIIGLGHSGSSLADNLGLKFFLFALSVREQRDAFEAKSKDAFGQIQTVKQDGVVLPWLELFREPPFVGDIVNQEMFPYSQVDMVPVGLRVPLPTKEIAEAWNQ